MEHQETHKLIRYCSVKLGLGQNDYGQVGGYLMGLDDASREHQPRQTFCQQDYR